jgi:hypothetical protein
VTLPEPSEGNNFIKVNAPKGASIFGTVLGKKRALYNSYGVALGFGLDQIQYSSDLRNHGVHVERGEYRLLAKDSDINPNLMNEA